MSWVCSSCGREYHDAPSDVCPACGGATVVPADDTGQEHAFATARGALQGESPESGLRNTNAVVGLAFRLLVLTAIVVGLVVAVALLL